MDSTLKVHSKPQGKSPNAAAASKLVHDVTNTSAYDKMDDLNKKAMDVMNTQGVEAAIKHMFIDHETGRELTYSEMRDRYG